MDILLFAIGFMLLVKGADWLVMGASSIASRIGIPQIVIGLSVVALGTSLPEFVVSLTAALNNCPDLSIGNILGSNICNILLILGICSMIRPLAVQDTTVVSEIPYSIIAALLLGFLANSALFTTDQRLMISRFDGIILLMFFILFIIYLIKLSKDSKLGDSIAETKSLSIGKSCVYVLIGCTCLYLGGVWVSRGAVTIAESIGFSQSFIGLTIVAVGTSLPELITSIIAAHKGNSDIAIGNVIGSNIINIVAILGFTSIISPLPFFMISNIDILFVIFSSLLIFVSMILGRKYVIDRWEGCIFLLLYICYIAYLVNRG